MEDALIIQEPVCRCTFFQPEEPLLFGLEGSQELKEPSRGQEMGKELGRMAQADRSQGWPVRNLFQFLCFWPSRQSVNTPKQISAGKESACNAGDPGSIPGSGNSPREGIDYPLQYAWACLVAQTVKNLPAMWETWAQSLGWEDHLEESVATHSSILAWRIPMDQRSLAGYSPRGCKEPDMNEWLSTQYK